MVNWSHFDILKEGAAAWNKWRMAYPNVQPDLSQCDLRQIDLAGAELQRTDLSGANLQNASFETNLQAINFRGADLSGAKMDLAFVCDSDLSDASCKGASFISANLGWTTLVRTDFTNAKFAYTSFCNVDLSAALLGGAVHYGPSTVGTDTLVRTALGIKPDSATQEMVENFLKDCGLDQRDIAGFRNHIQRPPAYRSAFICYSHRDQAFAELLHRELISEDVSCWLDREDMVVGAMVDDRLREAIREHDRVILCCSRHALTSSEWVRREIDLALAKEDSSGELIILPIDIDGYVQDGRGPKAKLIRSRNIADFHDWRNPEAFRQATLKLLRALEWGNSRPL